MITKIGFGHAYDQLKLSEETRRKCNFALTGGSLDGIYTYKRGLHPTCLGTPQKTRSNSLLPNTRMVRRPIILTREDKKTSNENIGNNRKK